MDELATSSCHDVTLLLATNTQRSTLAPPSTTIATHAKHVARLTSRGSREKSRIFTTTRRSTGWKVVYDFLSLCTIDSTSLSRDVRTRRVLTRTVTCLIIRRVTPYWSKTCMERRCSIIHHVSLHNILLNTSRNVGVQLRHLCWQCPFYQSGPSSTHSLDIGNCNMRSLQGHNCLLVSRWTIIPSKRSPHMLHDHYSCG
jgi:hypothetical protein